MTTGTPRRCANEHRDLRGHEPGADDADAA